MNKLVNPFYPINKIEKFAFYLELSIISKDFKKKPHFPRNDDLLFDQQSHLFRLSGNEEEKGYVNFPGFDHTG